MTAFEQALAQVRAARTAEDLFGGVAGSVDGAARYRRLAKVLHPDAAPPGQTVAATDAFARLAALWQQRRDGDAMSTAKATYHVGALAHRGDVANLYRVGGDALLKLPRHPADSDLTAREAHALVTLRANGEPRHAAYAVRLIESFTHRDPATGAQRTGNVLADQVGFVTLATAKQSYPSGVDPRDAAWMWRRLLVAIGYAHRAGVVHGAVLPEHVMIHPAEHGLVLVDWCYAITSPGEAIPAMVTSYRDWYPPEVPGKRPAGPGTDVYLASRCMQWLMGEHIPAALSRLARGCTLPNLNARPQDAWGLLAELDDLLHRLFGPRKFRPFTL